MKLASISVRLDGVEQPLHGGGPDIITELTVEWSIAHPWAHADPATCTIVVRQDRELPSLPPPGCRVQVTCTTTPPSGETSTSPIDLFAGFLRAPRLTRRGDGWTVELTATDVLDDLARTTFGMLPKPAQLVTDRVDAILNSDALRPLGITRTTFVDNAWCRPRDFDNFNALEALQLTAGAGFRRLTAVGSNGTEAVFGLSFPSAALGPDRGTYTTAAVGGSGGYSWHPARGLYPSALGARRTVLDSDTILDAPKLWDPAKAYSETRRSRWRAPNPDVEEEPVEVTTLAHRPGRRWQSVDFRSDRLLGWWNDEHVEVEQEEAIFPPDVTTGAVGDPADWGDGSGTLRPHPERFVLELHRQDTHLVELLDASTRNGAIFRLTDWPDDLDPDLVVGPGAAGVQTPELWCVLGGSFRITGDPTDQVIELDAVAVGPSHGILPATTLRSVEAWQKPGSPYRAIPADLRELGQWTGITFAETTVTNNRIETWETP